MTWAILTDVTKCIGCEECVKACQEANGLPQERLCPGVVSVACHGARCDGNRLPGAPVVLRPGLGTHVDSLQQDLECLLVPLL